MLKSSIPFLFAIFFSSAIIGQKRTYADSLRDFQQEYIKTHGAVKGDDRRFLHFYPVNELFRVKARVEKIYEAPWFIMETSGKEKKVHRTYAILHFELKDTVYKLQVYQSKELMGIKQYSEYLFVPFTDPSNGEETYENGRYIDLLVADLEGDTYTLDFNKAYNPYCAYISGVFNCPIPPKENDLPIAVKAGERKYGKEK
jgi:uncharacterized protein (DUF1684 family)